MNFVKTYEKEKEGKLSVQKGSNDDQHQRTFPMSKRVLFAKALEGVSLKLFKSSLERTEQM